MIGRSIGPYEITARIGRGAMGEVYRATDRNLEREVAIKVLPRSFAEDSDRLVRFEREAKILAALDHPHVATVYGWLRSEGVEALAMELVGGPSLAQRMREKLPLEESLRIALEIAEAVEAAHEQGIVHRDLKPGNVLLTEEGSVRVVDFGLAKSVGAPEPSVPRSGGEAPAASGEDPTELGEVLGTAGYMSPEQARAEPVDKRTDIWSFGVILYELLSGRRLAGGERPPDELEWLFHPGIDVDGLPRAPLVALHELLGRCLEPDSRQRLRDIGEARIAIERIRGRLEAPEPGVDDVLVAARHPGALLLLGAALLSGVAIGWLLRSARAAAEPVGDEGGDRPGPERRSR